MGSEPIFLWIGLVMALVTSAAALILLVLLERHRRTNIAQLERDLETLKQTVGALCSSAVGVDRRVNRIERQGRALEERQDNIVSHQQMDPPYADAIRMVKEGADSEALVKKLGLSHGAADLIIMMHGIKKEEHLAD